MEFKEIFVQEDIIALLALYLQSHVQLALTMIKQAKPNLVIAQVVLLDISVIREA